MYCLGVDLGTTSVAAAIVRDHQTEMVTLGDHSVTIPAVAYLRPDGFLLTGDAAQRRAVSSPHQVSLHIKRRLGDPTPVLLGGTPHTATTLLAALLRDVLTKVTETEGAKPDRVVLTHPANWGPFRRALFDEVPSLVGLDHPPTVTEPAAAAAHYATSHELRDGETIAVYDLGGGTFDATVLRARHGGVEILGTPEGIEHLGGVDFDEAVLAYVNYASGGALDDLDPRDAQTTIAMARLRQDCILAKEALSVDIETVVPVFLPHRHFDVELTRAVFEDMVRAPIESTIAALSRTLRSAHVAPDELSAVLLVGGSSRIPLVAQMVSTELGRPTLVDTHPKYGVALGAATLASLPEALDGASAVPTRTASTGAPPVLPTAAVPPAAPHGATGRGGAPAPAPESAVPSSSPGGGPTTTGPVHPASPRSVSADAATADPTSVPPGSTPRRPDSGGGPGGHGGPGEGAEARAADARAADEPPEQTPPSTSSTADGARGQHRRALRSVATLLVLTLLVGLAWYGFQELTGAWSTSPPAGSSSHQAQAVEAPPPTQIYRSVPVPTLGTPIPDGPTPGYAAVSPNGRLVYIANRDARVVTLIDTSINQVTATIPIQAGPPQYLTFAPDGRHVYISVFDTARTIAAVAVLDTTTNEITATVPVRSRPFAAAVTRDGRFLWVPNHDSGSLSVIDTATNIMVREIPVPPNPHWVEFSPDGTKAYTANHESGLVTAIATATYQVLAEVPVDRSPHSVAVHPSRPLRLAPGTGHLV
ncbi:Hsp70 family protein [Actinomycetospora cinnamomea]|nr:Hsp70 family protein [Actinomycetospora cinnamomea]